MASALRCITSSLLKSITTSACAGTVPLSLALLTAFALGVIAGWLASLRMVVRMQRQLVQTRKEVRQVEQEVINLRALPIKDVI